MSNIMSGITNKLLQQQKGIKLNMQKKDKGASGIENDAESPKKRKVRERTRFRITDDRISNMRAAVPSLIPLESPPSNPIQTNSSSKKQDVKCSKRTFRNFVKNKDIEMIHLNNKINVLSNSVDEIKINSNLLKLTNKLFQKGRRKMSCIDLIDNKTYSTMMKWSGLRSMSTYLRNSDKAKKVDRRLERKRKRNGKSEEVKDAQVLNRVNEVSKFLRFLMGKKKGDSPRKLTIWGGKRRASQVRREIIEDISPMRRKKREKKRFGNYLDSEKNSNINIKVNIPDTISLNKVCQEQEETSRDRFIAKIDFNQLGKSKNRLDKRSTIHHETISNTYRSHRRNFSSFNNTQDKFWSKKSTRIFRRTGSFIKKSAKNSQEKQYSARKPKLEKLFSLSQKKLSSNTHKYKDYVLKRKKRVQRVGSSVSLTKKMKKKNQDSNKKIKKKVKKLINRIDKNVETALYRFTITGDVLRQKRNKYEYREANVFKLNEDELKEMRRVVRSLRV